MKVAVVAMKGRAPSAALKAQLSKAVLATLKSERSKARGEINVIITDRPGIRRLNKEFLDETGDTDVIAFPYEKAPGSDAPFGDIYISAPVAGENARRFGDDPRREMVRLAVHGTLHLLGYDDHRPADRKEMWAQQEKLVEKVSPSFPPRPITRPRNRSWRRRESRTGEASGRSRKVLGPRFRGGDGKRRGRSQ